MDQFAQQLEEATAFLDRHAAWLNDLCRDASVEDVRLDFGVHRTDAWVQCLVLPPAFLAAVSNSGVSVELSIYNSSHQS